ncbi:integral membrane protein, AcrB/AcrD/AcrF family [Legionella quinlivanii]|uniref:Integral membrane protein, AcrB/AcrD/AcrF family n=1 Tax=Legionella quinlivanii TaxID=45073 RepID=A0A0W0XZ83_9GAMM|nr:efflux RND transporter permease subunit [Legionella quinlivanii]KTD49686.1 integral membrane protein, AcrB/AcrD/AcrF family [Legionella quinlivanii]MCW8451947.1 efflux RND transporter permease subunit [Legionella quinlivanii]SEG30224.1 multidrug efflux pump [Legionella quinlivanii DSM 21216]STY09856.1 integral membrane protein, AcrB/AcrD/AcrF family [Legionella quinlivanii]
MKITSYFIKHPVITIILNALVVVVGLLCIQSLSLREYPDITFPTISVSTNYPNASPDLVETAVTNILEDNLSGIEGLDTITSQSQSGSSEITLSFRTGTPMDRALSATQDAVGLAKSYLPAEVKSPRIERQRQNTGLPFIGIAIESRTLAFADLTHFANLRLKNEFRSVPGVSSVRVWGQPYTYNISLDPKKLYAFGINVDEVMSALERSRVSLPAGNYQNKIPSTLNSDLKSVEDYENLLIKADKKHPVFLKSIADIQLMSDNSQFRVRVNGHSGIVLSINRANDANPIEVSRQVRATLQAVQQSLPSSVHASIILDQSQFINASLHNIQSAILEAVILVLIIVFLFLRNWRATLIPLVTIPISLLGAMIFLKLFGFSINLMTLLAMVLAIGLVVDDAIIVLENIWRHIEKGETALNAAILGAKEIGFAIIAMTFTLASVYMPFAFIDGMLGQLFVEFAVALAGSVFVSGMVALTLSPLMCAKFLGHHATPRWPQIDTLLANLTKRYNHALTLVLSKRWFAALASILTISICILLYYNTPAETAPKEDRGLVGIYTPPLSSESLDDLDEKVSAFEKTTNAIKESDYKLTFMGDWGASILLPLKPHSQRSQSAEQIVEHLRPQFKDIPSVDPSVWSWNTGLPGIDDAGQGAELSLIISTPDSFRDLFDHVEKLKAVLDSSGQFESASYDLRLDTLGYSIELDNNALSKLGLTPAQVAKTIEVFFSADKSLTFQKDSVLYNLTVKGNRAPWTLNELYLTTPEGKRVSLGAFTAMNAKSQPATLEHYKQMRSTTLHVQFPAKKSIDKAMKQLWKLSKTELPSQYKLTWSGAAKAYNESSHTMLFLLLLSILFIYAILSIQFENFIDPLIILFTVPLACSGALAATYFSGQSLNVYSQVGLITLIGLISKHGILIVEFANQLRAKGLAAHEAVRQACTLRLRPILMTTGAMIFGAIPLLLSQDAGAESRHAIGTVLVSGLAIGTLFTLFVLPGIYLLINSKRKDRVKS